MASRATGKTPVSWWKKLLSYLWLFTLERPASELTPSLTVRLDNGRLVVDAANVNYAYGELDTFFRAAFKRLGIPELHMRDVLILGFGAGNVATILREQEQDKTGPLAITGVEKDLVMPALGRRYFGLDALEPLTICIEDATQFVQSAADNRYDLIVVDLFVEDVVPQRFAQKAFLRRLGKLLKPGGLLFFNRLMDTDMHQKESEAFLKIMQHLLPGTTGRRVRSNLVCLYRKPR